MTVVVVAEKPSVARDIARVLGAHTRGDGTLSGNGYLVTWAIGHLVGLEEPDGIDAQWRRWSFDTLPMFPRRWPLRVFEKTAPQFSIVRRALSAPDVSRPVRATHNLTRSPRVSSGLWGQLAAQLQTLAGLSATLAAEVERQTTTTSNAAVTSFSYSELGCRNASSCSRMSSANAQSRSPRPQKREPTASSERASPA